MENKQSTHLNATVTVPGSKSYTQRALVVAALAEGKSSLQNALISEDTEYMIKALRSLGADIRNAEEDMVISGTGGDLKNPEREIYVGNNGTAMRFLSGLVALGKGSFILTGSRRLYERPIKPLLDALTTMGVVARSKDKDGFPPVVIRSDGLRGGRIIFRDIESSQYISAILICAPYAAHDTIINLEGRIPSLPYVDITIDVMKAFGVEVIRQTKYRYSVKGGQLYTGRQYPIEGDCSSASYFFLAAALCKGLVRVENINPQTIQGDIEILRVLERLGCVVRRGTYWIEVFGKELSSGDYTFDLGAMPDMVPTLAVLGALRPGKTIITNCSHLKVKESDRLKALATELQKIGVATKARDDGLIIEGNNPHGAVIQTYNDHRIAMSFGVLGLAVPGIEIQDKGCVKKSFPSFWEELKKLDSR